MHNQVVQPALITMRLELRRKMFLFDDQRGLVDEATRWTRGSRTSDVGVRGSSWSTDMQIPSCAHMCSHVGTCE